MSTNEPDVKMENGAFSNRLRELMEQTRRVRRRENWLNAVKFVGITYGLLFLAWLIAVFSANGDAARIIDTSVIFLLVGVGVIVLPIYFLVRFSIFFWPFILYFWAGVWTVRQRTLLALVQASVETQTPLSEMIRAYACDCYSSMFRKRLEWFASILEQGFTLDQAIERDNGLFGYDVVGMIRLGSNDPETLQLIDDVTREERDYSPIRSMSIIRVAYLCSLVFLLIFVSAFILVFIIPKFEEIFNSFGTELPTLTIFVMQVSQFLSSFGFLLLMPMFMLAALLIILVLILQTNIVTWRPPFFREMFRNIDSAKMLRMFAVGVRKHAPISHILRIYRLVVPSSYLQLKALRIEHNIDKGYDWITSLKKLRVINGSEAALLDSAQRTGNVVAMLNQLAISKERAQLRKDDLLSKLVFIPCLLGFALIVGVFVVAMFLPLVKLITILS